MQNRDIWSMLDLCGTIIIRLESGLLLLIPGMYFLQSTFELTGTGQPELNLSLYIYIYIYIYWPQCLFMQRIFQNGHITLYHDEAVFSKISATFPL